LCSPMMPRMPYFPWLFCLPKKNQICSKFCGHQGAAWSLPQWSWFLKCKTALYVSTMNRPRLPTNNIPRSQFRLIPSVHPLLPCTWYAYPNRIYSSEYMLVNLAYVDGYVQQHDAWWMTSPLGTPRGRYDEYSSSFSLS
jgi:hypothetical protein